MKEIDSVDEWEYFQNEPDSMREIMLMYLTLPCVTEKCKDPSCTRYHNQDQRRRNPFKNGKIFYTPKKCLCLSKDCKTSTCIKYPDCEFSHNAYEMMYHPWCFKTKPCENKDEHRDRTCPYYHNMDQKRIPKSVRKSFEVVQEQLDYTKFKTHMCNNNLKHNEKQCVYYHGAKDKRRLLNLVFYIPEICIYIQSNKQCPNGEFCNRSHNQVEMFYHPEKFKSKFCSHYVQDKPIQEINDDCPYGGYCSFAHSHEEIRIKLIHEMPKDENFFMYSFKTVLCPFDKGHDKSFCVYAHNLQDFRRQPLQYYYNTNNCPRWDNKKTILTYTEGCEKGYGCMNCHGWKELDFHPLFYKTRKCKYFNNNCSKGALCPFYHVNESKRQVQSTLKEEYNKKIKAKSTFKFAYTNEENPNAIPKAYRPMKGSLKDPKQEKNISQLNPNIDKFKRRSDDTSKNKMLNLSQNILSHYSELDQQNKSLNLVLEKNNYFNSKNTIFSSANSNVIFTSNNTSGKARSICSENDLQSNPSVKSISPNSSEIGSSFYNQFNQEVNQDYSINSGNDLNKDNLNSSIENYATEKLFENIELQNKEIKNFFNLNNLINEEESDGVNDSVQSLNEYLKLNGFLILLDKLEQGSLTRLEIINLDEKSLEELVEEENKHKIPRLVKFFLRVENEEDADDLFKSIEKHLNS